MANYVDTAELAASVIRGRTPDNTISDEQWLTIANIFAKRDELEAANAANDTAAVGRIFAAGTQAATELEREIGETIERLNGDLIIYRLMRFVLGNSAHMLAGMTPNKAGDYEKAHDVKDEAMSYYLDRFFGAMMTTVSSNATALAENYEDSAQRRVSPDDLKKYDAMQNGISGAQMFQAALQAIIERGKAKPTPVTPSGAGEQVGDEGECDCVPCVLGRRFEAGEIGYDDLVEGTVKNYADVVYRDTQITVIESFLSRATSPGTGRPGSVEEAIRGANKAGFDVIRKHVGAGWVVVRQDSAEVKEAARTIKDIVTGFTDVAHKGETYNDEASREHAIEQEKRDQQEKHEQNKN